MVIDTVRYMRPNVGALLNSLPAQEFKVLSSDAAELLGKVVELENTNVRARTEAGTDKRILFNLNQDKNGFFSTLTMHLVTILKDGSNSSRSQQIAMHAMVDLARGRNSVNSSYGGTWQVLHASCDEVVKNFIRELFLQVGPVDGTDMSITGLDLAGALEHLCKDLHLTTQDDYTKPMTFGPTIKGEMTWKRRSTKGWSLSLMQEEGIECIPTIPPMYVNLAKGEIGPIEVAIKGQAMDLITMGKTISDKDIDVLRTHPKAEVLLANLPELPKIIVKQMGVATPKVNVTLAWVQVQQDIGNYYRFRGWNDEGQAKVKLDFLYKDLEVSEGAEDELVRTEGETTFIYTRDRLFEREARELISSSPKWAKTQQNTMLLHEGSQSSDETRAVLKKFHEKVVTQMHARGWQVFMTELWPLRKMVLETLNITATDLQDGWFGFDLSIHIDGARIDMLQLLKEAVTDKSLLAAIARADEDEMFSVRSPQGYEIFVPVTRLKRLLPFFLAITTEPETGRSKLRRIDFGVLEEARQQDENVFDGGAGLLEISKSLSGFEPVLPESTKNSLAMPARNYQEYAAAWCDARRKLGFGGVIGDEYAAGKTLQTILTIFNATAEEGVTQTCCLAVVTKTLFFEGRWQEDIRDFLPGMRITEIYGSKQIARLESLTGIHAVLTTYDTIVDSLEKFQAIKWNVLACDEGHKINNSTTLAHKAIAAIPARQKLIITGSPMQNNAREMWALMNLVAPGLLRDKAWFNKTFPKTKLLDASLEAKETSTDSQLANLARLNALGKIVSPFYMRRTNSELGRQLPPVQVIERHVVMEQDQADVYEAVRAAGMREALEAVEEKGLNLSRLDVLTQINRLRQVCCDPTIVTVDKKRSIKASSAKRAAIREICNELVADGRKIVITSEWNRLLENIQSDLNDEGIKSVMLYGDLSGPRRKKVSEEFRTGSAAVMLIQLTIAEGIELPEGDAIIICEPWWNRKKEEQAIARLRRDERDKHINVIRLIVPGSVELGVMRVAQAKLDDIEAVQKGHAAASGGLGMDDIEEFFKPLDNTAYVVD